MTTEQQPQMPPMPPVKIAFVIDGVVADILHTDDRLAAIFLSEPIMIDVTELVEANPNTNFVNATYDGKNFVPAAPTVITQEPTN